jgi:hypothetical protein
LPALGLALALAGCSAASIADKLPGDMGEPADAPARPATSYVYPAVHDMPPPRAAAPMTEEQQVKLEKDLEAERDRQEKLQAGVPPAPPPKKKAATKKDDAAAAKDGAKTNP